MIKISLTGIETEFEKIKKAFNSKSKSIVKEKANKIVKDLKAATPVDTGFARDHWVVNENNEIVNTAPYIENLNAGSSKQAPKYFVEKTCLEHGRAVGAIVEINPE